MAPPTQLAYRTLQGIGILEAAPTYASLPDFQGAEGNIRCCAYSPNGQYFAWASVDNVSVIDASAGHVVKVIQACNVYELGFSPLGTYLSTWQRPTKDENGDAVKNLKIWPIGLQGGPDGEGAPVGQFVQKSQTGWNFQYTSDEVYCARSVNNEIQFYQSKDLYNTSHRLRVEGLTDFALAHGKECSVAVFVPERKGQPAAVKVYKFPEFESPVSQKTFYKGDKVQLKWNDSGTNLIVLAQTDVDRTNKSYYGETTMYILNASGGFDSRIHLDKEGPIHDVSWSPNSEEFGVVYGYMPAKITVFNSRAQPKHDFSLGPRNTILFSPHGRFVLIAGFGNLAGQLDIYDLEKGYAKLATIEASNTSVCEWSPDGKHILTATTSPRLRVDNGVRIWHVTGEIMYNQDMKELYQICWRPQSPSQHPLTSSVRPAPNPHPSAQEYSSKIKVPSKSAGAYRPPGARGTSTPLHFKREDEGGSAFVNSGIASTSGGMNGFGRSRRREVPGAEPVDSLPPGAAPGGGVSLTATGEVEELASKSAQKNKKKREAKKAKEAAERAAGDNDSKPGNRFSNAANAILSPEKHNQRGFERSRSKGPQGRRDHSRRREGSQMRNHSRRRNEPNRQDELKKRDMGRSGAHPRKYVQANGEEDQILPDNTDQSVKSPGGGSAEEKKVRSLLKKMRAIEDLKMRQASGDKLEDTQVKKITTEDSIRSELESLGYQG